MLLQADIFSPETQTNESISLSLRLQNGRFHLTVGEEMFSQTMCEFMLTFSSMQGKDMTEYMSNLDSTYDYVSVPLTGYGKSVKLALGDFARLRSLYIQQMFEIKLEDLLVRQGIAATKHSASTY